MQPRFKTKSTYIFYTLIFILGAYTGIILSLAAKPGYDFIKWRTELDNVYIPMLKANLYGLKNPLWFISYVNKFTIRFVVIIELVIIGVMLYATYGNFIHGKEFGTSKWANPAAINNELKDRNTPKDKIYKETIVLRRWMLFFWRKK